MSFQVRHKLKKNYELNRSRDSLQVFIKHKPNNQKACSAHLNSIAIEIRMTQIYVYQPVKICVK